MLFSFPPELFGSDYSLRWSPMPDVLSAAQGNPFYFFSSDICTSSDSGFCGHFITQLGGIAKASPMRAGFLLEG